jgi:hypothetical protein
MILEMKNKVKREILKACGGASLHDGALLPGTRVRGRGAVAGISGPLT